MKSLHLPDAILRRHVREVLLTVDGKGVDARINVPPSMRLEIAHTITRNPPPRPHSLTSHIKTAEGMQLIGSPCFIHGTESLLRIPLPGQMVYVRDWKNDQYLPLSDLECDVWWH